MLRIALCDDEEIYINKISLLIESVCIQSKIKHEITKYTSGEVLLEEQFTGQQNKHDVVFLDIDMPIVDGIQIAKRYKEIDSKVFIIFLSNHIEFSREGYKVNAFRFIDKMSKKEEFVEAIKSVWHIQQEKKEMVVFSLNQMALILECDDIIYIEKRQRKTIIHSVKEGEIHTYESIISIRNRFESPCFYQVHRAFIVNLNHIVKLIKKDIILDNSNAVPLSEKRRKEFKRIYVNWKFDRGNS